MEQRFGNIDPAGEQPAPVAASHQPSAAHRHPAPPQSWSGTPVFPGDAQAIASIWSGDREYSDSSAIIAESLTVAVAQDAARHRVPVVLTSSGSFACHGANILRSLAKPRPVWVSDIARLNDIKEGDQVEVVGEEIATARIAKSYQRPQSSSHTDFQTWRHKPTREITEWDLSYAPPKLKARCYWSHRRYDPLTASVMIPGLQASVEHMTGAPARIALDEQGLLWFERAPSTDFIASLAVNHRLADPLVTDQLKVYDQLVQVFQALGNDPSDVLFRVTQLLREYFAVHLLLHDTYEDVFFECRNRLLISGWSRSQATELLDVILTPPVLSWQVRNRVENRKDLLAASRRLIEPTGLTPIGDAVEHEELVTKFIAERSPTPISPETRDYCIYSARVAVAKEWKFVTNKLLFSAFGEARRAASHRLRLSTSEVRLIPIGVFLELAGVATQ